MKLADDYPLSIEPENWTMKYREVWTESRWAQLSLESYYDIVFTDDPIIVKWTNGSRAYYENGQLHRETGPALTCTGHPDWPPRF